MNDFPDLPDASAILGHDDLWIGAMPTTTELTHLALTRDVRTVVACCRHVSYSANAVSGVFWLPMDDGPTAPRRPIVSAVLLMIVGAIADRSEQPARLLGIFAWLGAAAACMLFFLVGTNWRFGALMMIIATIGLGASLVVYDAILVRIAHPDDRDKVSSRGWALGYLGGGLLLALNLVIVSKPDLIGVDKGMAVRISMLSAGLWWWQGIERRPPIGATGSADQMVRA